MAKKEAASTGSNDNTNSAAAAENTTGTPETGAVQLTDAEKKDIKKQQEALKQQMKELNAKLKNKPAPKPKKEPKGVLVSFKNQAGTEITGLGTLYYVTRSGGKLHYKEATAVHVLDEAEIAAYNDAQKAAAATV